MSSIIGEKLKISVFGESHGKAIGCVIDGLEDGIKLDMDLIRLDMSRRAPGKDKTSTPRVEKDEFEILSGVIEGVTTGAPLAMIIENTNKKSGDYENILKVPRPSHSDYSAYIKYNGNNDVSGGGHFSGRLTAPIVFAGAVAKQALKEKGVTVGAHIKTIGSVSDKSFDYNNVTKEELISLSRKSFSLLDESKEQEMRNEVEKYRLEQNSIGGVIECAAVGVPAGSGSNMFDTVEGTLSKILFGIPAVKGVEFGLGFGFASSNAAEVNDEYEIKDGRVTLKSNNNGGVLGGITTGAPIVLKVAIKPTPSISREQNSVNLETMQNEKLVIHGRHDPCIVPRAVSVVEAAVAIGLLDLLS